ncbi:GDP-4-dehydro-6-deoxy-D-mannose reductase [Luteibacter sp. Sphag1AF]|uniref:NAD-dependent epimerase/dehydratase family protein n=1 Tax=Luteibacter sp. Sphag1AF TaxID=2587031 RepID=UPI0016224828|nr:NAD(P)-dependent oxidoreductase [Luteibacter sp. Sphag1AF]MBB3225851.1 GDP-4-dehydro-6-deoxy-D-mannose reductase [Luteibacter sp. Sphag1AF]
MTRVLLTGASGFIGRRLLDHLRRAGVDVTVVGRNAIAHADVTCHTVATLDAEHLASLPAHLSFDAVIHLAAAGVHPSDRDMDRLVQVNGHLPADLLRFAQQRGARAFVMTGSNAEYAAAGQQNVAEDSPLESLKAYGATKAAGAILAVAAGVAAGITAVNLRLFNVFGPGEAPHRLLPSLVSRLERGEAVPLSEGTQLRDFIHVDDACRAVVTALDATLTGVLTSGHYNVCSGTGTSVRDFALAVAAAVGSDAAALHFGELPMRPDDLPRVVGDPEKFASVTGWRPHTSVERAIELAVIEMRTESKPES